MIDPASIRLTRKEVLRKVFPTSWKREDVATPFDGEPCGCSQLGSDKLPDLTFTFPTRKLIETLGLGAVAGKSVSLTMRGKLKKEFGGNQIQGEDCVRIIKTAK